MPEKTQASIKRIQVSTKELRHVIQCAREKDADADYVIEYVLKNSKVDNVKYKGIIYNALYEFIKLVIDKLDINDAKARKDIESALHVIVENADPEDIDYALKIILLYTQDDVKVTVNSEDFEKLRDICFN